MNFTPISIDKVLAAFKRNSGDGLTFPWLTLGEIGVETDADVFSVAFLIRHLEKVGIVERDKSGALFRFVARPLLRKRQEEVEQ